MPYSTPATDVLLDPARRFLTDGGFETSMFFHEGFELPGFSAAPVLETKEGRTAMTRYFTHYFRLAAAGGLGFVLDTNSWRAGAHWAEAVGRTPEEMDGLTRDAVIFARETAAHWSDRVSPILVNLAVGPAGDAYAPGTALTAREAEEIHAGQCRIGAEAGADFATALTFAQAREATGFVRAARAAGLPSVVSFTVETDGRLPTGQPLGEAIAEVDRETGGTPLYFMVNCAHPEHFSGALAGDWTARIGGVRANASRLSHAELDECETLDDGDPEEWGRLTRDLAESLPNLRVVGGCCGTDHRHVAAALEERPAVPAE